MTDTNERLGRVEGRLDSLSAELGELRGEVGELRGEVGELREEVGELRADIHKLSIHHDDHLAQTRLIAKIQAHHGEAIEEIRADVKRLYTDMQPLRDLYGFVRKLAIDHEQRIESLEAWAAGR